MPNIQGNQERDKAGETAELNSTWGMLIDYGMHEAKSTLIKMEKAPTEGGNRTREAWMMVDRAFQSSAKALRALTG